MDLDALLRFLDPYLDQDFRPPAYDPAIASAVLGGAGRSQGLHERLLQRHNGFYAFGGLLHVLGACAAPPNHALPVWNDASGWRHAWGYALDGCTFFAQSAFGDQFGYRGGKIIRFRALEGRVDVMHAGLEEWLEAVILDPEFSLDKRLFDACVRALGPLPHGGHFAPLESQSPEAPLDPSRMQVIPTRDSLEIKAAHVKNGTSPRRRTSNMPAFERPRRA
jgi:hypothetical protein